MKDNIRQVHELITDKRLINVRNIVNELEVSIGIVKTIIHSDLHYRKITA